MNIVVGVADMQASNDPERTLITYSLGSCIGISIYDPVARAGGLLHFMLPESSLDPDKAASRPFMFADTGIPRLFKVVYALGGEKRRMRVIVVGGSQVLDQKGIGRLVETAVTLGKKTRKNIKLGICGEHGGEPKSVEFCYKVGLNYVSCSPYRVPIARLAAAQAALKDS